MTEYFITTHIPLTWEIPFKHITVGVEGYHPIEENSVAASNIITKLLDSETAFGALRSLMAINSIIEKSDKNTSIFTGTYRLFLSKEINKDWLSPILQENLIISPHELNSNWRNLIALDLPEGVDIMIPAPRLLPDTVLGQYSRVHHLDDLLYATGCAIRAGLLEPLSVPKMLSSNTLIPYGNFASKKEIKHDFNERLWWCAHEFYKNHYIPRNGYQRRVIDFVFERITSMALIQMIVNKNLNCVSCRNIWISQDGNYKPSI